MDIQEIPGGYRCNLDGKVFLTPVPSPGRSPRNDETRKLAEAHAMRVIEERRLAERLLSEGEDEV